MSKSIPISGPAEEEAAALQKYRDAFIKKVAELRGSEKCQKMDLYALPREWEADKKLLLPFQSGAPNDCSDLCANLHLCDFYPRALSQNLTTG